MNKEKIQKLIIVFIIAALIAIFVYAVIVKLFPRSVPLPPQDPISSYLLDKDMALEKFSSQEEFRQYLVQAGAASEGLSSGPEVMELDSSFDQVGERSAIGRGGAEPSRFSETNVQVAGIDEPDIVKTDGKNIFVSSERPIFVLREPVANTGSAPITPGLIIDEQGKEFPRDPVSSTQIVGAFPPDEMSVLSQVEDSGQLLLSEDMLVVSSSQILTGYNVSDPDNPAEAWSIEWDSNSFLSELRLKDNTLYVVSRTGIDRTEPCPFQPLTTEKGELTVSCESIYHPVSPVPTDVVYTVAKINVQSGVVEDDISFTGSSATSAIALFPETLYVTYQNPVQISQVMAAFLEQNQDIVPGWAIDRVRKLNTYDIGEAAKMTELSQIMQEIQSSLSGDERLQFENELRNRGENYFQENAREMESTGIVRVRIDDLDVVSTGSIPGRLLNQFSLDEYKGALRVATTIGGRWMQFSGRLEEVNDVYVLNDDMGIIGSAQDLGKGERIYAVRFMEDKGYVVTFKEIDPLYVLDLSSPKDPKVTGELKIPGYSSYLHPLKEDLLIGIGKEEASVKVSLFDVRDEENPKEIDNYILDENWSDILNTHHAFLADKKHEIFFLPGSRGGYIFSYSDQAISLERAVSGINAQRAIYIEDVLYIIGAQKIIALDENTWSEISSLTFQ